MTPAGPGASLADPATLLQLIEDSGHAPPVIEEAVRLLRRSLASIDLKAPALADVLRAHVLCVGSPTDVTKYFSLELLERAHPRRAEDTAVELVELLARSPLAPERAYHVERAVVRSLGERKVARALPALALLAGRQTPPLSRTAARAVAAIVGSEDRDAISERLARPDFPEVTSPKELAQGVARALAGEVRRSSRGSDTHKKRAKVASSAPPEGSDRFLRPESRKQRQARLRAVLRAAGRETGRCGNCDLAGKVVIAHVVLPARGGTDRAGNLVALCRDCFRRKAPRKSRAEDGVPRPPAAPQMTLFS